MRNVSDTRNGFLRVTERRRRVSQDVHVPGGQRRERPGVRVSPWDAGSTFSDWEEAANPLEGTATSEFSFIKAGVENYKQKSCILDQAVQNTHVGTGKSRTQGRCVPWRGGPRWETGSLFCKKSDFLHYSHGKRTAICWHVVQNHRILQDKARGPTGWGALALQAFIPKMWHSDQTRRKLIKNSFWRKAVSFKWRQKTNSITKRTEKENKTKTSSLDTCIRNTEYFCKRQAHKVAHRFLRPRA